MNRLILDKMTDLRGGPVGLISLPRGHKNINNPIILAAYVYYLLVLLAAVDRGNV